MTLKKTVHLLACALFACSLQGRTILFDNINEQTDGADTLSSATYNSFSTGANSGDLSHLQLVLVGDAQGNGSFDVSLFADSGATTVGDFVMNLGNLGDLSVVDTTVVEVHLNSRPTLLAWTRYWIGLIPTASATRWSYSFATIGTGVDGEYFSVFDAVFPCSAGCYQMEVALAAPTEGAPEPASGFLGAAGLAVAGAWFRLCRKRRQHDLPSGVQIL